MRGSAALRTGITPGGALAGPWVRNPLWTAARAVPSLDLQFAENKSLTDATTGQNLVTFTRASSGTYVDSQGVIRTAVTNLLLRSEEFDNASWQKFNSGVVAPVVTSNQSVAPSGVMTADKIELPAVNSAGFSSIVYQAPTQAFSTSHTFSCYLRGEVGGEKVWLQWTDNITRARTLCTLTTSWQRFSLSYTTSASGAQYVVIGVDLRDPSQTATPAQTFYVWGAQLEQSATVGEYIPTTSTINSAPRFDHNPTTGESLGLLVEEQRTNSIRNNTMVGAVAGTPGTVPTNWSQSNNTGLAANVIGTGTENGITYIDLRLNGTTTGTGQTNIVLETSLGVAAATGQVWSLSPYLKIQAGSLTNVSSINLVLQENTAAGVAVTAGAQAVTIPTSSLGVYRPTFTRTLSGGATVAALMPYIQININTGLVIDFTLRIGLPQLEQGAFATSVIPTTTAAATRSADVASITGSNFGVSRTNLLLRSEEFDNASWILFGTATRSANATTAPNGTQTADSVTLPVAAGIYQLISGLPSVTYTFSIWVRADSSQSTRLVINTNLSDPVVSVINVSTTWQRYSITKTTSVGTTSVTAQLDTGGGGTFYLWGAQLETGSAATAYIPTTSAAVTVVDSPWYRQDEGTVFTSFSSRVPTSASVSAAVSNFDDGTANNRFSPCFYSQGAGIVAANQLISGVLNYSLTGVSGADLASTQRAATALSFGNYGMSVNGLAPVTDSSAVALPTVDTLRLGLRPSGSQANAAIRRLTYWPTRLSNSTLASITQ